MARRSETYHKNLPNTTLKRISQSNRKWIGTKNSAESRISEENSGLGYGRLVKSHASPLLQKEVLSEPLIRQLFQLPASDPVLAGVHLGLFVVWPSYECCTFQGEDWRSGTAAPVGHRERDQSIPKHQHRPGIRSRESACWWA